MGTSLKRSEDKPETRDPYIFRFRCETCGAERDQNVYRRVAWRIRCICGGDAIRLSEDEQPTMELIWWTKDGKLVNPELSYIWLKHQGDKHRRKGTGRRSELSIARSWLHLE